MNLPMQPISFCAVLVLGSMLVGTSQADDSQADLFKSLDKNNDGIIVKQELSSHQYDNFERLIRVSDQNDDGKISRKEFVSGLAEPDPVPVSTGRPGFGRSGRPGAGMMFEPARLFQMMDQNRDGKLVLSEVPERAKERLTPLFDVSGKRELTREDFEKLMNRYRPQGNQSQTTPEMTAMPAPEAASAEISNGPIWRTLDRNDDGKLTTIEMELAPQRLMSLDRNRDGKISMEEIAGR